MYDRIPDGWTRTPDPEAGKPVVPGDQRRAGMGASAVPKMRVNGRGEDVIFFDGVFFEPSLKSIFFVS